MYVCDVYGYCDTKCKKFNECWCEEKEYHNIELNIIESKIFRNFLINNNIKFEASQIGGLIHFELLLNNKERILVNNFLEEKFN